MMAMLNSTEPTSEEIKQAASVLAQLTPGELPLDIFIEVARLTVTPIVEVVPLRKNEAGETEVLLTVRDESDPTWAGMLHTPGTVVRASDQDENNGDAFRRILDGELGGVPTSKPVFVTSVLHKVKRGMEQAQVFWVEVKGKPVMGEFYPAASLPENIVDTQIDFIKAAAENFEASRTVK